MPVYVDNARHRYGRMIMCHMLADTPDELHAMADQIGVARKWFQRRASTPHYDICQAKRKLAVKHGAIELDRHALADLIKRLRQSEEPGPAATDTSPAIRRKARKTRNRARRAVENAAKMQRAINQAGIPVYRFIDRDPEPQKLGVAPQLLEVTGLGRGARPAFVRAPNKALTLYRTKGLITHPQYEAGMRLWLDYEEASIPPAIVPEMGRIMVDGGKLPDWPLPNIDADRRLRRAIAAIPDPTDRAMIIHVCLYGSALATGSFPCCQDKNAKMPRFRKALDRLRLHYQNATKD